MCQSQKRDSALVFSSEFCETFKNTFFYRTRLVATSGISDYTKMLQRSKTYLLGGEQFQVC